MLAGAVADATTCVFEYQELDPNVQVVAGAVADFTTHPFKTCCDRTGIRNRDLVGPIPESDSWFLIPAGIPEFGYPGVLAQYPTGRHRGPLTLHLGERRGR